MRKILFVVFTICFIGSVSGQKIINDLNAEKRVITSFHGIDVATGIHLTINQGSEEEVAVSANNVENRDKIVTEVVDGILKIYYDKKTDAPNKKDETKGLRAYVSFKTLDKLNVTTGAKVDIEGVISSSVLKIESSTGGIINGEVNVDEFTLSQSTGSRITLAGKVNTLRIEGNTGSRFSGEKLNTVNCNVDVNTGAKVWVNAEKEINAKASTGAMITYSGNPEKHDIKKSTGGKVSSTK